jgi:prepilin-type N-terminal cleavage/methylation domain-containing protein
MSQGPQSLDRRGTKAAPTFLGDAFHLLARDWPDVRNVPAHAREGFYHRNDHDDQKRQMDQRRDNRPEKYQDATDTWNRGEHHMHDSRHDVEEKPSATEDDGLHSVETHKTVVLFQNVENNAADQWNAGNRRSHVRRQTGCSGVRARLRRGTWRRRRRNRLLVWHDLHTQNGCWLVKQSRFCGSFSLSLTAQPQYHALLTAKSMAKCSPPSFERAFTLIEVIVVLAVIAIMMSLVYPAYTTISNRAKATKDMSNLRQIGIGMQTYLNDKDNILPVINAVPGTGTTLNPVIYPKYIATRRVFQSPFDTRTASETDAAPFSYGINQNMYDLIGGNLARVVSPSSTILMAANYNGNPALRTSWAGVVTNVPNLVVGGGAGMTIGPQANGAQINALFCDLHAETMTFGPPGTPGTFKDATSDPLGLKHWDPTK